jgi:hypothetical protein
MEMIVISKAVNARNWCVRRFGFSFIDPRALRARPANLSAAKMRAESAHRVGIGGTITALLVPIDLSRRNFLLCDAV